MAMEHLAVREYWDELTLPSGRTLRAPGAFVKASRHAVGMEPPGARGRRAHRRGARLAASRRSSRPRTRARRAGESRRLPLEGVKVADFSWIGVGPITAKALADHGATVVHIESDAPGRPPAPRRPVHGRRAGDQPLPVLRVVQHVEAVAAAEPQAPRRPRPRQAAAGVVRRRPRLVHRRHDGRARPRLRRRPPAQPGHHHGDDVPARPDRPGRPPRRLRLPRRRGERVLRDHRLGRPPAGRSVQRLHRHHRARAS